MGAIDRLDLSQRLDRGEYERRLTDGQRRLLQLRLHLGGELGDGGVGPGLLVLFEGPDASGKGGAIKTIVGHLDPRHYTVVNYSAPTPREKRHHFLWRFYREVPGLGGMAVFDRSWYGRVLVEPAVFVLVPNTAPVTSAAPDMPESSDSWTLNAVTAMSIAPK